MKNIFKYLLLFIALIIPFENKSYAQDNNFLEFVKQGNDYSINRKFPEAIEQYLQAYKLNNRHSELLKIISSTYLLNNEFGKCIEYANKIITLDSGFTKMAYSNKATAYESLKQYDSAVVAYQELIKRFGNDHRWRCDLADNYLQLGELTKAEEILTTLVREKPSYPKTHLILSQVKVDQGENVPALLSLYFYLLLEPNQKRAKIAFEDIRKAFSKRIRITRNGIEVFIDEKFAKSSASEYGVVDMKLTFEYLFKKFNVKTSTNQDSTQIADLKYIFITLGEAKKDTSSGLWWDYYIPFFYGIAKSEIINTFAHIIYASTTPSSAHWLDENPGKLEAFITNVRNTVK